MYQDLTKADRFRVPKASKDEFDQIKGYGQVGRHHQRTVKERTRGIQYILPTKKTMQHLMPVDVALEQGDPTLEKILGERSS